MRSDPIKVMEAVDKQDVKKLLDVLQHNLAFKNKTVAEAHKDVQIVDIIKNYVVAKGIPFGWTVVDSRETLLDDVKIFLQNKSDVFDYLLLGQDLYNVISVIIDSEMKDIKCDCGHFNEKGNILAGELLLPEVERMLKNVK